MTLVINDQIIKIVVIFDINAPFNAVKNYLQNQVLPELQIAVNNKLQANFTDYSLTADFRFIQNPINDQFEVYPKLLFSGTTELTAQQLKTGVDNALADLKTTLKNEIIGQGGTPLFFHVHRSTGSATETE